MKHLAVLLILLLAIGTLLAESIELIPSADLYNLFPAAYVDPTDPASQPILFYAIISGTSPTTNYEVHISIDWNGNTLLQDGTVEAKTPFASMQYTSRDLIAEENQYFENGSFSFDDVMNSNQDFEDAIRDTGRFPDGAYMVTVSIYANGQSLATDHLVFNVVSPISIQLLYPGTQIGGQVMPYMETFPNFVWASNLSCYTFRIWDLEGMANVNAEEIENMEPMFSMPCQGFTTLPYPAEAPSLEVGKTYAWQVVGGVTSPGDLGGLENSIKSPVFVFQVASPNDNEVYNQILANFLNNLGGQFGAIYELLNQGYTPTGTIVWNGQEMSFEELNAIIIQVLSGELELHDLIIE